MLRSISDGGAAVSPSPPEIVCVLTVKTILDDWEVKICCQRTNGVDRVFSTDMDWLCAERASESNLFNSVAILLPIIISRCLHFVGEPIHVRAGLLNKKRVEAIISDVYFEMDKIKKENELLREAEIVKKAAHLGLHPETSNLSGGTWIACCPGTNHPLQLQPKRSLFYCGYCKVGGGINKLDEFAAERRTKTPRHATYLQVERW
jgi:hypothetical protein